MPSIQATLITLPQLNIEDALAAYDRQKGWLRRPFGDQPHIVELKIQLRGLLACTNSNTNLNTPENIGLLHKFIWLVHRGQLETDQNSASRAAFQFLWERLTNLIPGLTLGVEAFCPNELARICNNHSTEFAAAIKALKDEGIHQGYLNDLNRCGGAHAMNYANILKFISQRDSSLSLTESQKTLIFKYSQHMESILRGLKILAGAQSLTSTYIDFLLTETAGGLALAQAPTDSWPQLITALAGHTITQAQQDTILANLKHLDPIVKGINYCPPPRFTYCGRFLAHEDRVSLKTSKAWAISNLDFILGAPEYAPIRAEVLWSLEKNPPLVALSDSFKKAIKENPQDTRDIAQIYRSLAPQTLWENNIAQIEQLIPLTSFITQLTEVNMLNQSSLDHLLSSPAYAQQITNALVRLKKSNIHNPGNINKIMLFPERANEHAHVLSFLNKANYTTAPDLKSSAQVVEMLSALDFLDRKEKLTRQRTKILFNYPQTARPVAILLSCIEHHGPWDSVEALLQTHHEPLVALINKLSSKELPKLSLAEFNTLVEHSIQEKSNSIPSKADAMKAYLDERVAQHDESSDYGLRRY